MRKQSISRKSFREVGMGGQSLNSREMPVRLRDRGRGSWESGGFRTRIGGVVFLVLEGLDALGKAAAMLPLRLSGRRSSAAVAVS